MREIKRIGVFTSGGDCAGLNAALRAVVHRAIQTYEWEVYGIHEGTRGLMVRPLEYEAMTLRIFTGTILRMGGTILGSTTKGDPFAYPSGDGTLVDRSGEIIAGYHELGLDALIGIGGDGSLAILKRLAEEGDINVVAIPKTIDNDIACTEVSVGFETAVSVATEALDRLQPTAASHSRVMILEVMGRDAGHIALSAGIAGGADIILIPEIPYRISGITDKIEEVKNGGRNFSLVVAAEAVPTEDGVPVTQVRSGDERRYGGIAHYLSVQISSRIQADIRVIILGHLQRGGQPVAKDRLIASAFGVHAVDLVAGRMFNRMVAWKNHEVIDVSIADAISKYRVVEVDGTLAKTARGLGIYIGDQRNRD